MAVRTAELPGIEKPRHKAIEKAAEEYRQLRDRRMTILREEIQKKNQLLELMKKHQAHSYSYDVDEETFIVECVEKENVKVKLRRDDDAEGDGGDSNGSEE